MNDDLAYRGDAWEKRREEIIDGELVMMSPRPAVNHSQVAGNIYYLFAHYLRGKKCVPFADGVDLFLGENNRFVPDFMVVCDRDKIRQDGVHGAPDLVVEVLSPSTARNDRTKKKNAYQRVGVLEYWIVSPEARSVDVYLLKDGRLEVENSYAVYPDWQLAQMTEEEKAAVVTEFQCSLYDDLTIQLDDIFYNLF